MQFHLATLNEAISDATPDRDAIVFRDRRISYRELRDRTRQLANLLLRQGLGKHAERSELKPWESGQDHVGLYLYNGNEYLEGMLGAMKAGAVPFNVNYRYVDEELIYLLNNASAKALIYHASLAEHVQSIRSEVPTLRLLIQVQDSEATLLEGAVEYEAALSAQSSERPNIEWSPDDLYILYTGGTTGMPKGVLWRQGDIVIALEPSWRSPDERESCLRACSSSLTAQPLYSASRFQLRLSCTVRDTGTRFRCSTLEVRSSFRTML